uniref:MYND-type domain-containing protein n=1 Tax=Grammatophora oceanica TaxID=210454 RepID=A0A7S1UYD1_9STRA
MPPHVMAALRAPHIWWQVGAAIVRRRWLRPLAPILMSPLVALYCRARRLLKKRGVSRRRWACSLCRRRARWKCVRCLRSYYCSRQCQNVSWHIVHKHVCYKPARFWWSFVIYGITILAAFPGMLRDPFLYDLALSFIPISFYVMAVLGGGVATFLKKAAGLDLRGRFLELIVVLATGWLVGISWGLVWGFFGETDRCVGVLRGYEHEKLLALVNAVLLKSGVTWFLFVDRMISISALQPWVCTNDKQGCFSHLPHANAEMIMTDTSCRSDLSVVLWLWFAAGASLTITTLWKRRRRAARPHQD